MSRTRLRRLTLYCPLPEEILREWRNFTPQFRNFTSAGCDVRRAKKLPRGSFPLDPFACRLEGVSTAEGHDEDYRDLISQIYDGKFSVSPT